MTGPELMKKQKIALFLNHPECSVHCAHGIIRALSTEYDIDCFNRDQIKNSYFKKYDVIAFPGGIGDSDSWHKLLENTQDVIKNQMVKGKYYLGICMGAYWAGRYYFDLLDDVEPVQYLRRNNAEIRRSYSTIAEVEWLGVKEQMFFYDGCSFTGNRKKFKTIAKYANNDPAAIIQNNLGLIGPHPESDVYWYNKPYLNQYWHNYKHHDLLLDFVKLLTNKY